MKTIMKQKALLLASVAAVTVLVGCDKPNSNTTSQQLDKVEAKTAEAAQDMKDYTYAQKAEFSAKMQAQLDEINKDLDQLQTKIDNSEEAVKAEAQPKLEALREKAGELRKHLDNVKNSTEPAWENVKAGAKKACGELKDGFNQARQWVSDKIKP